MPRRKVTFEKVSEDENGKVWHVEAIHVTTTRNNRKYSKEELMLGARSLSYRPININHDESRWLPYNPYDPINGLVEKEITGKKVKVGSNTTLIMDFSAEKNGVVGDIWITDKAINERLERGEIKTVSIEQFPTKGEACSCMLDSCTCEQNGIVFTGIGLLETFKGVQPGDPAAKISKEKVEAFKCEECGKEFETKEALEAHYADAHKQESCECIEKQFMKWAEEYLRSKKLA